VVLPQFLIITLQATLHVGDLQITSSQ